MIRRTVLIAFLLLSISSITNVCFASDSFEVKGDWQLQYSNTKEWSALGFDEEAWQSVQVPQALFQKHNQPVLAWYRVKFDFTEPVNDKLALLIETIRHADEVWLNGTKIGGLGETYETWNFMRTNPQSLSRLYEIPDYLITAKDNVLAIKVNVGFGDAWGAMFPGGSGIVRGKVLIGDYGVMHKEVTEKTLKIITIDTIFIILGLIDFLIVLFLIKTALGPISEFKWLLLTSFFLLLGSAGHDINFVYSISIIDTNLSMAIAMLILPYTTAMYFWSQSRDVQRGVIVVMSLVWAVNVFVVLVPSFPNVVKTFCWYIWNLQAVLFFLYSIFSACRGVINRRVGAIAQLLGIAVYVISIRSQWLPMEHFDHRNVQIGSLFYRYTLLIAYFQQMAKIRIDHKELNIKLVSVVEKVRHSIARELHDGIGQYLASVKLQTKLSEKSNKLNYSIIYEQLDHSIVELRRLINGLHPVIVDELSIAEALHLESKKLMEVYSVIIDVDADEVTLNEISRANIFRIFQECVANAIKHGDAKEVSIKLKSYKNTVKIEIRDNGKGFVPDQKSSDNQDGGYGLISIYERVSLLNGAINIKSTPSEGTSVTIELPLTSSNLD